MVSTEPQSTETNRKPNKSSFKGSQRVKTKFFNEIDVLRTAWTVRTFEDRVFIKHSLEGLFIQKGNLSQFRTIDEIYPYIRTVVDSKGLIIAKRKHESAPLVYCKDKGRTIPLLPN